MLRSGPESVLASFSHYKLMLEGRACAWRHSREASRFDSLSQSKMFHLSERLSTSGTSRTEARRYLKRAFLFGAGLLLLWVSLQLLPSRTLPNGPPVYSDDAGTVASRGQQETSSEAPGVFTPGNLLAVLLLCGGVGLAVHLRRRAKSASEPMPITPLGWYSIGPHQSLRLVECGDEVLLLGVTSGQVNLLRSYPSGHFDEMPMKDETKRPPSESHFADVLHRYVGDRGRIQLPGTTC